MKRILLLLLSIILLPMTAFGAMPRVEFSAVVKDVVSGDTITISYLGEDFTLQIHGVFSPRKGHALFDESKKFTSDRMVGNKVNVDPVYCRKDKKYKARVKIEGRAHAYDLLENGMAVSYFTKDKLLRQFEGQAKNKKLGVWGVAGDKRLWLSKVKESKTLKKKQVPISSKAKYSISRVENGNKPSILMTNKQQLADSYSGKVMYVEPEEKIAEILGGSAPNIERSKYKEFLQAVVVVFTPGALGSGFFVNGSGLILTNAHVVGGSPSVKIKGVDGETQVGKVLARDPRLDLALIQVEEKGKTWLNFDWQLPGIGEEVMAIGAPKGLEWSVTKGVVSSVRSVEATKCIQTDAAINGGNSGGPLISLQTGDVVGIVTMKRVDMENTGFAVSTPEIQRFMSQWL